MRLKWSRIVIILALAMSFGAEQTIAQSGTPVSTGKQTTIAGNALNLLPEVDTGTVEVITAGERKGTNIPVVVKNNSESAVADVVAKVEIRDNTGKLIGVGDTANGAFARSLKPYLLNPGDVAVGVIYVEGNFAADATYTYLALSSKAPGRSAASNIDVEFGEVNWLGDRVVGEVVNPANKPLISVDLTLICISVEGMPLAADVGAINDEMVPAGATSSFQMTPIYADFAQCENFLISGTGRPG